MLLLYIGQVVPCLHRLRRKAKGFTKALGLFLAQNSPIGRLTLIVAAPIIRIEAAVLPPGQLHTVSVNDALNDGDSVLFYGIHTLTWSHGH